MFVLIGGAIACVVAIGAWLMLVILVAQNAGAGEVIEFGPG